MINDRGRLKTNEGEGVINLGGGGGGHDKRGQVRKQFGVLRLVDQYG